MQSPTVRTSIDLPPDLEKELEDAKSLTGEKQATLIRVALRVGLPVVKNRYQAPRPPGYFASDYKKPDGRRIRLEQAMAKVKQRPDR